jgi:hypothetical protein
MTEVEHRYVIKFLHTRKFSLSRIVTELASVYGEQPSAKKVVEYSVHQVRLGRTFLEDQVKPGGPSLDDIGGRILTCLNFEPFIRIRSIAQVPGLAPATVHRRLTMSLDMRPGYFQWVPDMLTPELGEQRTNGSRALLDVLPQQGKSSFRETVTGDESWIFVDTDQVPFGSCWTRSCYFALVPQSVETNLCPLSSGMKGIVQVNWLSKDARINAADFRDEVLTPMPQKLQEYASGGRKSWRLVHMDRANVGTAAVV